MPRLIDGHPCLNIIPSRQILMPHCYSLLRWGIFGSIIFRYPEVHYYVHPFKISHRHDFQIWTQSILYKKKTNDVESISGKTVFFLKKKEKKKDYTFCTIVIYMYHRLLTNSSASFGLSAGVTGSFLFTSLPPFSKIK